MSSSGKRNMLVEYTARTYTRIQIVQYTTTRFFTQNDESNSIAMNTAKKCGCKKFVKICGCKMGHDPRKLGKLSVDRYSDIQLETYFLLISSRKGSKLTLALPSKRIKQVCFSYLACSRSSIRMFCVAT